MAFWPVEDFDDASGLETRPPQELLSRLKRGEIIRARSRWLYMEGEWDGHPAHEEGAAWQWRRCEVLAYRPFSRLYLVQWSELAAVTDPGAGAGAMTNSDMLLGGQSKWVGRLNLLYDDEVEALWALRVELALQTRAVVEAELRYQVCTYSYAQLFVLPCLCYGPLTSGAAALQHRVRSLLAASDGEGGGMEVPVESVTAIASRLGQAASGLWAAAGSYDPYCTAGRAGRDKKALAACRKRLLREVGAEQLRWL